MLYKLTDLRRFSLRLRQRRQRLHCGCLSWNRCCCRLRGQLRVVRSHLYLPWRRNRRWTPSCLTSGDHWSRSGTSFLKLLKLFGGGRGGLMFFCFYEWLEGRTPQQTKLPSLFLFSLFELGAQRCLPLLCYSYRVLPYKVVQLCFFTQPNFHLFSCVQPDFRN